MSYEVIARKWRPQKFDEVIGQSHITQTLKNEIASGRIAHAFLFSGIRGVGKTTTARILAKALNCRKDNTPTPTPCEVCDACVEIKRGIAVDVLEIDAASNRGIDEIRELREGVKYAPAKLRYKVYIIDEVHMLTREAFNALLKTLEEPPPHVVFILATTDVHKIPVTILSRCQRFDFRRVPLKELTASLRRIVESESVQIDEQSLVDIAKASEGSIRDAQSLLDQIISYGGPQIRQEEVRALLGIIGQETLKRFAEVILSKNTKEVFQLVEELTLQGYDWGQFCKELIAYFRHLIVVKLVPDPENLIEEVSLDLKSLQEQARSVSLQELQQIFKFLLETEAELKRTSYPRFALEMALVRATQLASLQPLEVLLQKIYQLEEKLASAGSSASEDPLDLFSGVGSRSRAPQPSPPPNFPKPVPLVEKTSPPSQEPGFTYQVAENVWRSDNVDVPPTSRGEEAHVKNASTRGPLPVASKISETPGETPGEEEPASEATSAPGGVEPSVDIWQRILHVTERTKPSLSSTLSRGKVVHISREVLTIGFSKSFSFAKEKVEESDSLKFIRDILHKEFKMAPQIKVTFLKEEDDAALLEGGKSPLTPGSPAEQPVAVNTDSREFRRRSSLDQPLPEENEQKVLEKALQIFDGKIPE